MGNKQAATVLAKQLINVRKQKTRTYNMSSKVGLLLLPDFSTIFFYFDFIWYFAYTNVDQS